MTLLRYASSSHKAPIVALPLTICPAKLLRRMLFNQACVVAPITKIAASLDIPEEYVELHGRDTAKVGPLPRGASQGDMSQYVSNCKYGQSVFNVFPKKCVCASCSWSSQFWMRSKISLKESTVRCSLCLLQLFPQDTISHSDEACVLTSNVLCSRSGRHHSHSTG